MIPKLTNVPETMLWTLHNRASEAMRHDAIIDDEKAVEIYNSIDYNYERSFGKADPSHAIRSRVFDKEIKDFISNYPEGTIVNLGEGLETQRFRVYAPQALWLSIDLPEAIVIREQFIQPDERHLHISISATDIKWFEFVPKDKPVFIAAQGLFMYFKEDDVKSLIKDISHTFEQGYLMFDIIPKWLSKKTMSENGWRKTEHYTTPKMPWGINRNEITPFFNKVVSAQLKITDVDYATYPRGIAKWLFIFLPLFQC